MAVQSYAWSDMRNIVIIIVILLLTVQKSKEIITILIKGQGINYKGHTQNKPYTTKKE